MNENQKKNFQYDSFYEINMNDEDQIKNLTQEIETKKIYLKELIKENAIILEKKNDLKKILKNEEEKSKNIMLNFYALEKNLLRLEENIRIDCNRVIPKKFVKSQIEKSSILIQKLKNKRR